MALKATVHKANIELANIDRHDYRSLSLTIARHPSETEERMMLRLLARFAFDEDDLEFGRGLSTTDEPDVWSHEDTGDIRCWISLGTPDPKWLKRAGRRTRRLIVLGYGGRSVDVWWSKHESELRDIENAEFWIITNESLFALASMADRNMRLSVTVQSGMLLVANESTSVAIELHPLN